MASVPHSEMFQTYPRLSKEAQVCLAGDMQRVAKLIATKADYEVIRELAKLEGPEQTGQDWDERWDTCGAQSLRACSSTSCLTL